MTRRDSPDPYAEAAALADRLAAELKQLGRWSETPLPATAYENMGAFGENTMAFEQWIQFVLLDRLREIVRERGPFPPGSQLATYAVRALDGDPESGPLRDLLYAVDTLVARVNGEPRERETEPRPEPRDPPPTAPTVALGDSTIPAVLYAVAQTLPKFEGDDLDSQLQTFDIFLQILSPTVRPEISALLRQAAAATESSVTRTRIDAAADSVARGGRAASS